METWKQIAVLPGSPVCLQFQSLTGSVLIRSMTTERCWGFYCVFLPAYTEDFNTAVTTMAFCPTCVPKYYRDKQSQKFRKIPNWRSAVCNGDCTAMKLLSLSQSCVELTICDVTWGQLLLLCCCNWVNVTNSENSTFYNNMTMTKKLYLMWIGQICWCRLWF